MHVLTCFCKKIASYRCFRGVVQVFVRAIWGKTRLMVDPATRCKALGDTTRGRRRGYGGRRLPNRDCCPHSCSSCSVATSFFWSQRNHTRAAPFQAPCHHHATSRGGAIGRRAAVGRPRRYTTDRAQAPAAAAHRAQHAPHAADAARGSIAPLPHGHGD